MYISVVFKKNGHFIDAEKAYEFKLHEDSLIPTVGDIITMNEGYGFDGLILVCHGAKVKVVGVYSEPTIEHHKEILVDIREDLAGLV